METVCVLCEGPIAASEAGTAFLETEKGQPICADCTALSAEEQMRLRDEAMARMLRRNGS